MSLHCCHCRVMLGNVTQRGDNVAECDQRFYTFSNVYATFTNNVARMPIR